MTKLPHSIQKLIDEFAKLPGVGPKTAARLTFYMLGRSTDDVKSFGKAISELKDNLVYCDVCYNIAESNPCEICGDFHRLNDMICVVEEPLDIIALGKTDYKGMFHVLGGVISPIDGIGPENLRVKELLERLKKGIAKEVILATDPSLEGEATASFIVDEIENLKKSGMIDKKLRLTRIARGLPVGGDLEYADEVTLTRAIEGRREV
jgi:recombination protein RecR